MEIISKLNEAAKEGNIELLLQQLRSDPLILKTAAISSTSEANPLEIACLAGHIAFVKEFLKYDNEFVRQLNFNGLSPLHIAAAIGNVEIVKEILKVDLELCLLRGRETKIPLHVATVKGKVVIVKELLLACVDSVETVTSRGETALHLSVRHYQFDVLCELMEHVKRFGKVEVVNKKDERGNTVLHLAAAKKQHEVFDLVLKGMPAETISKIEVNSSNEMGHTALDLLLLTPSEAGDREIEEIIRAAGGLRATEITPSLVNNQNQQNHESNHESPFIPPRETTLRFFQYDAQRDSPSNVRNVLLLIATLITTTTFQASLSPPTFQNSATDGGKDSASGVLSFFFMCFNTVAFFSSLLMINILIKGFPLIVPLRVSIMLLGFTYVASALYGLLYAPMMWWFIVLFSGFGYAFLTLRKVYQAR